MNGRKRGPNSIQKSSGKCKHLVLTWLQLEKGVLENQRGRAVLWAPPTSLFPSISPMFVARFDKETFYYKCICFNSLKIATKMRWSFQLSNTWCLWRTGWMLVSKRPATQRLSINSSWIILNRSSHETPLSYSHSPRRSRLSSLSSSNISSSTTLTVWIK